MTLIRSRSRLLRLAGVMLLTAAIAVIPVGAAFADSHGGGAAHASPSALMPPTPPDNLRAAFVEENAGSLVQLNWEDSETTINPLCYGAMFPICLASGFGLLPGVSPADLDAPTTYVVERRQPRQQNSRGFYMNGEHDWTEIATLSGPPGGAPDTAYRDGQFGAPSRTMDYRVKACNAQGCSAWSTTSVYIRWSWCAAQSHLCD